LVIHGTQRRLLVSLEVVASLSIAGCVSWKVARIISRDSSHPYYMVVRNFRGRGDFLQVEPLFCRATWIGGAIGVLGGVDYSWRQFYVEGSSVIGIVESLMSERGG
jgi:hypothetical protein